MVTAERAAPPVGVRIVSPALANFEFAIEDVERLLGLHDSETGRRQGRTPRQVEVFKRAAIILSVTAWESFIEDAIGDMAEARIRAAARPADIQSTFNTVAQAWLQGSLKAPYIAQWAGDGWKLVIMEKLRSDLQKLNTPNSNNVRDLSKRYLDIDITAHWSWKRTSPAHAAARLDSLIEFRGDLVHRGPELFRRAPLHRRQVEDAVGLLRRIVERTEGALAR